MLIGMNREGELKLHLRAAKNNGVTRDEIKEVLMQSAIYCGIPAANATFHLAEEVWDELGVESLEDLFVRAIQRCPDHASGRRFFMPAIHGRPISDRGRVASGDIAKGQRRTNVDATRGVVPAHGAGHVRTGGIQAGDRLAGTIKYARMAIGS